MLGPNWPNDGEIDIIEGINDNTNNAMTLHTSDGCSVTNDTAFSGTMVYSDCYIYASNQPSNAGCSIENQNTSSYGTSFNSIGGGVIVTEWTSSAINIWWFPRGTTPSDLTAGNPNPASWSEPVAQYQGGCDIPDYFADLQFVNFPSCPFLHPFPFDTLSATETNKKQAKNRTPGLQHRLLRRLGRESMDRQLLLLISRRYLQRLRAKEPVCFQERLLVDQQSERLSI